MLRLSMTCNGVGGGLIREVRGTDAPIRLVAVRWCWAARVHFAYR